MVSRDVLLMISVSAKHTPHRIPASSDRSPARMECAVHGDKMVIARLHLLITWPRDASPNSPLARGNADKLLAKHRTNSPSSTIGMISGSTRSPSLRIRSLMVRPAV
jgi:hypothetical protein